MWVNLEDTLLNGLYSYGASRIGKSVEMTGHQGPEVERSNRYRFCFIWFFGGGEGELAIEIFWNRRVVMIVQHCKHTETH